MKDLKERLETPGFPYHLGCAKTLSIRIPRKAETLPPQPHNLGGRKGIPQERREGGNEDPGPWTSGGAKT